MAEPSEDAGASSTGPTPQPRVHPRPHPDPPRQQPAAVSSVTLAQLAEAVRALREPADRDAQAEAGPATGRPGQKGHRFQRAADVERRPAHPSAPTEPAAGSPAEADADSKADVGLPNAPAAPPRRPASGLPAEGSSRPAGRVDTLRKHPFLVWIAVQAFCFGLLLCGVFLGATESGPAKNPAATSTPTATPSSASAGLEAAPVEPSETTERALRTADLAFAKEDAGDLSAARGLLESLAAAPQPLPGTEYQLALLALRRGDRNGAESHLARSLAARQAVAPCCYLRAAFAGAKGDYREASAQLQSAALAEPFNGRYFFYWGEALRRNGKLADAAACLREALARPLTVEERDLYDFKLRLAQVEAGRGDPFGLELGKKLLSAAPPADWLLLGAAQDVQHNVFAAAAAFLERAKRLLPPETYQTWVSDYAFQNYANEPEIARYLQVPPPLQPISGTAETMDGAAATATPADASSTDVPTTAAVAPPPAESTAAPAAELPPDPTVCPPAAADPALWRTVAPGAGD